jgi:phytoene synthase
MTDPFPECERLVREGDKDRFLASLFAPARHRPALMALYAFAVEVDCIPNRVHQPLAAEVRLQWWREALSGGRPEEAAGHPVASALTRTVAEHSLPLAVFDALLDAHLFDATEDAMPTLAALADYARKTSSALFGLAARILDPRRPSEPDPPVDAGGIAYAYARLLQALPRHAARQKLFLPLEVLERHGARAADVLAGRVTAELEAALAELRAHARAQLAAFDRLLPQLSAEAAPAMVPVALVEPLLARMERHGYDPARIEEVPQWRRQWILWRAALRR